MSFKNIKNSNFSCLMSISESQHNAHLSVVVNNEIIKPLFEDKILIKSSDLEKTYHLNGAIHIVKINELLKKNSIKSCFIKKNYTNQADEQKILKNNGKVFLSNSRIEALKKAEEEGFEIAILDDGLQDKSIDFDLKFVCFNNKNWIGNGLTIPAGPLRESIKNLKN